MKSIVTKVLASALLLLAPLAVHAAVVETVNPATLTNGYMNVFELPVNGGGWVFGSGWGVGDLCATWSGSNVTLSPNTIGDPNPFWYIGGGAPGNPGNKIMEANLYAEPVGSLPGVTLTFVGNVISNTLAPSHTVIAFVKDFAADFSSFNMNTVALPPSGTFSVSLATVNDPARHVQWGFQTVGPCVWYTDVAAFGSVVVGPDQATPAKATTWGRVKNLYR